MDAPVQEFVTRPPAPGLRPFVDRYIGYRLGGFPPGLHRGLPSRHMTFIVSIGPPIEVVVQTNRHQAPQNYGCVLGGLQAAPALIAHDGNQEGVAIEMTPLGSRAIFGMPARELWNLSLELSDVVGSSRGELWERLQGVVGWDRRFEVCDQVLAGIAGDERVAPELRRSWQMLITSGGRVPVGELATEVGYTRQHLGRLFRDEFGLGPKLAARVVRFERARRMLRMVPSFVSMAQVAVACGYYDQSHLNRDFAELAGCTPTELLVDDVPAFQGDERPTG